MVNKCLTEHTRCNLPVGLYKRTRILTIDGQPVPSHTIRSNRLVSNMELVCPRYTGVGHRRTKRIRRRSAGFGGSRVIRVGLGNVEGIIWIRRSRRVWVVRCFNRTVARGIRRAIRKPINREVRAIDLTPLRIATLLTFRKRGSELAGTYWNPAGLFVLVLHWTSIPIRCCRSRRSVSLAIRRLSRPLERQWHVIVWVIVRSSMSMRIGGWPSGGVLCHRRSHNVAHSRGVELGRGNRMVNR